MLTQEETESLKKKYLPANLIWVTFIITLIVYVLICRFMADSIRGLRIDSFELGTIKFSLIGASMAILVLTFLLRTAMLDSKKFMKSKFKNGEKRDLEVIGSRYLVSIIISMALSELIGIFGIILFFIYKDEVTLYQFVVFSGVAMLYFKPRKDEILEFARGMEKGSDRYIQNKRVWEDFDS